MTKHTSKIPPDLNLEPAQEVYYLMLMEEAPYLMHLFDWHERTCYQERVDKFIQRASHGESIMARVYIGIWWGKNEFEFDLLDAVKALDELNINRITKWLKTPFWP